MAAPLKLVRGMRRCVGVGPAMHVMVKPQLKIAQLNWLTLKMNGRLVASSVIGGRQHLESLSRVYYIV